MQAGRPPRAAAAKARPRDRREGGRPAAEPLAALGPPALQDRLAGARRHAGAKAVLALAAADVRLGGALQRMCLRIEGRLRLAAGSASIDEGRRKPVFHRRRGSGKRPANRDCGAAPPTGSPQLWIMVWKHKKSCKMAPFTPVAAC